MFTSLAAASLPCPLATVPRAALLELQRGLGRLGYLTGPIDGRYGRHTQAAWAQFRREHAPGEEWLVDEPVRAALTAACAQVGRSDLDMQTPAAVQRAIAVECRAQGLMLPRQIAYVLATAQWETNHTWRPVREAYWLRDAEAYRRAKPYYPYYGRGFVQLTWRRNYAWYGALLGIDLVAAPDHALDPHRARFVLVHGFKTGAFTGHRLDSYVNAAHCDYRGARRCINGLDRAGEIVQLAREHEERLTTEEE